MGLVATFQPALRSVTTAHTSMLERGAEAVIRTTPEDFQVDEIPLYAPSGEGTHTYVHFEKRGLGTHEAVALLAQFLAKPERDTGVPGLKDKHAVSTQWVSFEHVAPDRLASLKNSDFSHPQMRVLEVAQHGNKLRTGHLLANRFALLLRDVDPTFDAVIAADLKLLEQQGMPNYYGSQRFGRRNIEQSIGWVEAGLPRTRDPKFLVSVLQSLWFNEALRRRVADGTFASVVAGDLAKKEDTGGMFVATDMVEDVARAARFEISATGPMFGADMRWPEQDALAFEQKVLSDVGADEELLQKLRRMGAGTRRPYRVKVSETKFERTHDGLRMCFTLPSGSYATSVLDELMPYRDATRPPTENDGHGQVS